VHDDSIFLLGFLKSGFDMQERPKRTGGTDLIWFTHG